MGNSIDKIDDGFYICGVQALEVDGLKERGITHILNAAYLDLYRHHRGPEALSLLPQSFTVKTLECEDSEDCNISVHFEEIAEFIEAGRKQGGVVVHCAAGISRACTAACAYLMIKQNLSLGAAFYKVHSARNCVHPNDGFWRQLRDLENVLKLKGQDLKPLHIIPEGCTPVQCATGSSPSPCRIDFWQKFTSLNEHSEAFDAFAMQFLTASLEADEDTTPDVLADRLQHKDLPGIVWHDFRQDGGKNVNVRAKVVPGMDSSVFRTLLIGTPGVRYAACEQDLGGQPHSMVPVPVP